MPDPKKLTQDQLIKETRSELINVWLKNLIPQTALHIMGHAFLGQAIKGNPHLNNKEDYVQFKDDEQIDPAIITVYTQQLYVTSIRELFSEETVTQVMRKTVAAIENAIKGADPVVAKSMRMFISYEGLTPTHDVVFSLTWMTAKVQS